MNIRFAQKNDIEQIVKLCETHAHYEKAAFDSTNKSELLSKHLFEAPDTVKCLIVELKDEIVGYATFLKQFSTWDANFYVYLDCLFLKEKTRGKGLGIQIMEQVKEYAKFENCDVIQWQTPEFNTGAISFYQKLGAKSKTKERFFWNV